MPVVQVPGQGDVEFPDNMSDEQIAAAIQKNLAPQPRQNTMLEDLKDPRAWKRALGLVGRASVEGIAGLPYMAADAGVAARNLLTGSNYEVPSVDKERLLNKYLPQPKGLTEKLGSLGISALVGSRLPVPEAAQQAPANFVKTEDAALQAAQNAGLKIAPSAAKPTLTNKLLEAAAGRPALASEAAAKNTQRITELAAPAAGLEAGTPITLDALRAVRNIKAQDIDALEKAGTITADSQFADDIASATSKFVKAKAGPFGGVVDDEIAQVAENLPKDGTWDAQDAVFAGRYLRDKASEAFRAGRGTVGRAYKQIADAIENATERSLEGSGKEGVVAAFRSARTAIAKNKEVEEALNTATGNVMAKVLAKSDAPLSGNLKTIADFYNNPAFQPFAKEVLGAPKSFGQASVALPAAAGAISGHPWWYIYPFAQAALREGILSPTGQRLLTGQMAAQVPGSLIYGAVPPAQQGLLGQ